MALNLSKTYRVLNYCSSPVVVATRNDSVMIPASSEGESGVWNFSVDELQQINNMSKVFKVGRLWFDEDVAADLYNELKIFDWKDILTDAQIEDIILNPTIESIEKILKITDRMYFERIYGIFIGMRNAGYSISLRTEDILRRRFKELSVGKTTTEIQYKAPADMEEREKDRQRVANLEKRLEEMQEALAAVGNINVLTPEEIAAAIERANSTVEEKPSAETAPAKPKTTRGTKKTTSKTKANS